MSANPATAPFGGSINQIVCPMVGICRAASVAAQKNPPFLGPDLIDLHREQFRSFSSHRIEGRGHGFKIIGRGVEHGAFISIPIVRFNTVP